MSSITPYLTTNNLAYASCALFVGNIGYGHVKPRNRGTVSRIQGSCALLSVVGIAAVVIKEKSLQSSKWAIVTSIAFSAFATSLCVNDRDFRQYPTFAPTVGFNLGLSFYAAASLIIATGKLLGSYLPRR